MTSIAIPSGFAQPAPSASIFSPRVASPPPGPGPGSRAIPAHQAFPSSSSTVVSAASTAPPITHPFPTLESLKASSGNLEHQSDAEKIAWAQDVYRVVERQTRPVHLSTSSETPKPRKVSGSLTVLLNLALPIIISSTSHSDREISALASYLKGIFSSTGLCPDYLPRDPRQAFKEFESAARGGETRGWFMLGRDYESVGDEGRARDCLDRGVKKGDTECNYRMGMAHLLGQLGFPPNPSLAIPYLIQAAEGSTVDVPHPAYVYGMLLAGDFELPPSLPPIPEELLGPSADVRGMMARENIDKAAYLCHPPAQYKCGLSYEHATLGCPYDPLMSVQWYSLASQGGEVEADMALSKWFLCGAEGNFGKNEDLARTFAEKAARRGHPNGCFAMGYYFELGIGGRKDMDQARKWYTRAAKLDNSDAIARLAALSAPRPATFSLADHQAKMNDTLIRTRTIARIKSERSGQGQTLARRHEDEERVWMDTQRAARLPHRHGHRDSYAQNGFASSPTPRVGEVMSPGMAFPARMGGGNSTPSRRPIPYHAFTAASGDSTLSGSTYSFPSSRGLSLKDEPAWLGIPSGASRETPVKEEKHRQWDTGPQTFAEMGFVSKPVEDEGCVVM